MSKINYISFVSPNHFSGGGELIMQDIIQEGINLGHQIKFSTIKPKISDLHASPDLTIFVDIHNFGHTAKSLGAWRGFSTSFLSQNMEKAPFIHFNNAYTDICNLGFLPCMGVVKNHKCTYKKNLDIKNKIILKDYSKNCSSIFPNYLNLYEKAAMNVYLSPLHKEFSEKVLGLTKDLPSFCHLPSIDINTFKNENVERDIDYLFVGHICKEKGFDDLRKNFYDKNIHFIGKLQEGLDLNFGTYHGFIEHKEIPLFMNRAKNFIFLPQWPEPFGRVVAEAAMCGCEIIGNSNIGALSYKKDLSSPLTYKNNNKIFWDNISAITNKIN